MSRYLKAIGAILQKGDCQNLTECADGTYTTAKGRGACAGHGGIKGAKKIKQAPPKKMAKRKLSKPQKAVKEIPKTPADVFLKKWGYNFVKVEGQKIRQILDAAGIKNEPSDELYLAAFLRYSRFQPMTLELPKGYFYFYIALVRDEKVVIFKLGAQRYEKFQIPMSDLLKFEPTAKSFSNRIAVQLIQAYGADIFRDFGLHKNSSVLYLNEIRPFYLLSFFGPDVVSVSPKIAVFIRYYTYEKFEKGEGANEEYFIKRAAFRAKLSGHQAKVFKSGKVGLPDDIEISSGDAYVPADNKNYYIINSSGEIELVPRRDLEKFQNKRGRGYSVYIKNPFYKETISGLSGFASFSAYMRSAPRYELSQASNNGTSQVPGHPRADDAGNWTGCAQNVGRLVGTYRDISACFLSHYLGRPATEADLLSLTFQDVSNMFRPIWDSLELSQLMDQDTANLVMHIKVHFGNIRVVQRGLNDLGENLTVDGVAGPLTRAALQRQTSRSPNKTYNAIRNRLVEAYSAAPSVYRNGFLRITDEYFPAKTASGPNLATAALYTGAAAGLFYFFAKRKRK